LNFLNLSLGELLGLATAISAGVVALYLLDRSKRRQIVATLRFWTAADVRTELKHRRRIQQPWSLVLQLVSLALLLLALAGPFWGGAANSARDHVLILDTSAWMGARTRQGILMDDAREQARNYIKALPSRDRVLVLRADALATPATAFESNRNVLEEAIRQSQPGSSALNLEQALAFATRTLASQANSPGEIVFAGAGRVPEDQATLGSVPGNLRVLPVATGHENVGLRKLGMRRSPASPDTWEIFVSVRNYGTKPKDVELALQFGGSPAGSRHMTLKPDAEEQATFTYKTKAAGWIEARLLTPGSRDAFPQDDRARIDLPAERALHVVVYSNEPEALRPLLASNAHAETEFQPTAKYDPQAKADIVVLDRFAPPARPKADSIWIEPPASSSPIAVKGGRKAVKLERWRPETILGAGLRTKDVVFESAEVFTPSPGDIPVAETNDGALVIARPGPPKMVLIGFHPVQSAMKFELATPLLIANAIRWMSPEAFREWEVQAGTVGTVSVALDKNADAAQTRVVGENGKALPFTIDGSTLRFFSGAPGTVRVVSGNREVVYAMNLPDVGESAWKVPPKVRRGLPKTSAIEEAAAELWPWLAVLGGIGLLIDWLLFGRSRAFKLRAATAATWRRAASSWRKAS
jgi:hypothetical protein